MPRRIPVVFLLSLLLGWPATRAAVWREDFAQDPARHGWNLRGNPSLHAWNPALGRLDVTWDSSRPNTFFHRSLGTVLTRADRFRFAFDLVLDEIQPSSDEGTFQIAVGLIRTRDAFATNFFRGAGIHPQFGPRNILEFDYFPASRSITPTFSGVAVGTNNLRWTMANVFPLELTPGNRFRIELTHDPDASSIRLRITRDGEPYGESSARFGSSFGDFRFDAFSITSYSGDQQPANYGGQILARGWIDDLEIETPAAAELPSPRPDSKPNGTPQITCDPRPGWVPRLEQSSDLANWTPAALIRAESDGRWSWSLSGGQQHSPATFFRLAWDRP